MKKILFFKKYAFLFYFILISSGFSSSVEQYAKQIEEELVKTKCCNATDAKIFLSSLDDLSQGDIAEALRISESTLSEFLNHEKFKEFVLNRLEWYYTNATPPLSLLKRTWERLNSGEDAYVEAGNFIDYMETSFIESKKYVLLPRKLKDRENIKKYLLDLIEIEDKETVIKMISDTLPIKIEILRNFLLDGDNAKYKSIYISLRNYYRSDRAQKLSQLIVKEEKFSFMDYFRNLSLYSQGYKTIKQH
jgi:hypothetical protein